MPPHATATANVPAAFAARMSNGESPTYAASSGAAPSRRSASSTGSGSGLCRSVSSAPMSDLDVLAERREAVERELHRRPALGGDDPEPSALRPEDGEQVEHAVERLERLVERLVVRAVGVDELVDAVGVEVAHLRDQAGPADRGADELLVRLAAEHRQRGVAHRGEDDRPGVDQRAVEVEQHDGEAHGAIVATPPGVATHHVRGSAGRPAGRSPRARGTAPTAAPSSRPPPAAALRAAVRSCPARTRASSRRACAPCGAGTSRP